MSASATSAAPDFAHLVRLEGEGAPAFEVHHTNYRLHLQAPAGPAGKVAGHVFARALKISDAAGGGTYIEPLRGAPRIVQGRVIGSDPVKNWVLVNAGIPMWVEVPVGQAASAFRHGDLLNFYVESGTRFEPVAAH